MFGKCNCLGLAAIVLAGLAGCDGTSGPAVEYVEGKVTLDGQPVEGAIVGFSPIGSGDTALGAVGTTDASGVYKMTTMPTGTVDAGAVAGDYNVTIQKLAPSTDTEVISEDDPRYEQGTISGNAAPKAAEVKHLVPQKYNSATTSGLKVTVKPGSNKGGEFDFDLKSE
ncbi:MAG: hypothetical protein MUF06_00075 [Pirellulaceae bacterium]|jgi:hypothetical protein|nr:hypothetical protein [Pirellulaceae bacterium]